MEHPSFPSSFRRSLVAVASGFVAAFTAITPAVQAQLYDFNTPGQLADDFTRVAEHTPFTFSLSFN